MSEMARTGETYHIPIMVADEAGNMNLKIVRGDGESGLIQMALHLQTTGTVSTTFRYEAGSVSASVECETAQMREMFASQAPMIAQIMQEETGFAFSFSFTQSFGLSAADIYNMEQGNYEGLAAAGVSGEASQDEIQTQALYSIARGYINVIAELF